jgi:twitching motility protein PilT
MLGVLAQQKAQELRIESNQPVRLLLAAGGTHNLTPAPLSGGQIGTMVLPLLPDAARRQLPNQQEIRFEYSIHGIGQFKAMLQKKPEGICVYFRLAADPNDFSATQPAAQSQPQPQVVAQPQPPPQVVAQPQPPPAQVTAQPQLPPARVTGGNAIDALFRQMAEMGCSDLHLSVGSKPMIRKDGSMKVLPGNHDVFTPETMRGMLWPIMPELNREEFNERHDTDFAYEISELARFRANIFMDRKGMGAVFRIIPSKILTAEQLGLSNAILGLCGLRKGLVVVTGPTGSGKSTTLCAMIDHINSHREEHIITIEDPIEFVHENKRCLVNQREVHNHTQSFKNALRAALREDPDIVLVGEMRDLETISIAIETAETGHLVFGTLHTTTAASTVDRIIDQFPADRQEQIRAMLSESLRGVIAQTLLKKKGGGRVAALEVLLVTPAISNMIREGKTFQIPSVIQTSKGIGMVSLNDALIDLVKRNLVDVEEAYDKAVDKAGFEGMVKREGIRLN